MSSAEFDVRYTEELAGGIGLPQLRVWRRGSAPLPLAPGELRSETTRPSTNICHKLRVDLWVDLFFLFFESRRKVFVPGFHEKSRKWRDKSPVRKALGGGPSLTPRGNVGLGASSRHCTLHGCRRWEGFFGASGSRLAISLNDFVVSRHNRARIRVQLVGEMDKARGDGPLDGILPELFFRTILQQSKQIIFHHAHSDLCSRHG